MWKEVARKSGEIDGGGKCTNLPFLDTLKWLSSSIPSYAVILVSFRLVYHSEGNILLSWNLNMAWTLSVVVLRSLGALLSQFSLSASLSASLFLFRVSAQVFSVLLIPRGLMLCAGTYSHTINLIEEQYLICCYIIPCQETCGQFFKFICIFLNFKNNSVVILSNVEVTFAENQKAKRGNLYCVLHNIIEQLLFYLQRECAMLEQSY